MKKLLNIIKTSKKMHANFKIDLKDTNYCDNLSELSNLTKTLHSM